MIELRVKNNITQVFYAAPRDHDIISSVLRYQAEGFIFSPKYKQGIWDGYVSIYRTPTRHRPFGKFWTGNLYRVCRTLDENNIDYKVLDCRKAPKLPGPVPCKSNLRDYQIKGLKTAIERTRGVIKIPTGGGKTRVAGKLIAELNLPTIFLVHRINLLNQTVKAFKEIIDAPIGVIQGQKRKLERFNVAMIQTLDNILSSAVIDDITDFVRDQCQLIICDEVHHAESKTYGNVLDQMTEAYYRFGLSATPESNRDRSIRVESLFGRVIHEVTRDDLTVQKHLAKAHVFFI